MKNLNEAFSVSKGKVYNRTIKPNANPLMIFAPNTQGGGVYGLSKEKKQEITNNFLRQVNKADVSQLTPNEKIRLQELLRPTSYARSFLVVPVFDVSDTIQIEGKEDFIKGTDDYNKLQWHQADSVDEAVKPIYNALLDVAKSLNINVSQAEKLRGGSRGVSKSGSIEVLQNQGNDVGLTKTLAHELTHELLHQKYAGSKNPDVQQFFIGKEQGRQVMEQQAELSAWIFMDAYGFDVKTTSLNYTLIWGGNKDNMVKVFDTVSGVVNYLIDQVNERLKASQAMNEEGVSAEPHLAQHIGAADVAKFLGVERDFNAVAGHHQLKERFYNLVNK